MGNNILSNFILFYSAFGAEKLSTARPINESLGWYPHETVFTCWKFQKNRGFDNLVLTLFKRFGWLYEIFWKSLKNSLPE